jgi:predicted metal-dependent hydrolase
MLLQLDDLSLEVRWSSRRRSIELTVERDGSLTVRAPEGTDAAVLSRFVSEKRPWLYRKLAEKKSLRAPVVAKEFVSGEGFAYLGRSYRLLLIDDQDVPLKLEAGRFRLRRSEADHGRELFVAWYLAHAEPWMARHIGPLATRIGVHPHEVIVRDLGRRWGSCTHKTGRVRIHWATILMPPRIVEYILVHELAHLLEPNHSAAFWLRVERVLPDYRQRRQWLAEHGAERVVL